MPEAIPTGAAPAEAALPQTAAPARRQEGSGLFWLLVASGLALIVPAWLLPWFVEPVANGIGFSPQDALTELVTGAPTGIGSALVCSVLLAMLGLIAGSAYDLACVLTGWRRPFVLLPWRGLLALAGAASTLGIWVLIGIYREEDLFGSLSDLALTDNAVWMMLTGFLVMAFAYLQGRRILLLLFGATGVGLSVTGIFVPWFRTNTPRLRDAQHAGLVDGLGRFNGADTLLLYLVVAGVVVAAAGFALDLALSARRRTVTLPLARWRGMAALAAAGVVVAVASVIGARRVETFGAGFTTIDDRLGFMIAGLVVTALTLLLGERLVRSESVGLAAVAFVIGGLFPLIFNQSVPFIAWGASAAAIYTLLALGLNVVVGFAGLLDLGYAAFFAIGAYTSASLNSPRHGLFLPFWVILFIGAAAAALFGAILGAPTLRLRGDYLAIVTLGFGEIVPDMAKNNFLSETGGPNGITGIHAPSIGAYSFGLDAKPYYWALIVIIALVIVALRNLEHSRLGRAWVAVREDEIAASATGINTVSTKLLAFAIGASVSGLAGAFYGAFLGIVTPEDFEFAVSVTALSTVVLGGIGNNSGAAVGALLISFVIFWILPNMQEWMGTFGNTTGITSLSTIDYSKYKFIIYGVILMSIMLLRPGGLLPSRARRIELQGAATEALAAVRGIA